MYPRPVRLHLLDRRQPRPPTLRGSQTRTPTKAVSASVRRPSPTRRRLKRATEVSVSRKGSNRVRPDRRTLRARILKRRAQEARPAGQAGRPPADPARAEDPAGPAVQARAPNLDPAPARGAQAVRALVRDRGLTAARAPSDRVQAAPADRAETAPAREGRATVGRAAVAAVLEAADSRSRTSAPLRPVPLDRSP